MSLLITVDRVGQLTALRPVLTNLEAQGIERTLVALELDVYEKLQAEGIASSFVDDLIGRTVHCRADADAIALAHGWFELPRGRVVRDVTRYGGISLGRLVAWEMSYFFAEALRCLRNVETLLDRLCPEAVLMLAAPVGRAELLLHDSENFHHDALIALCAERDIPCEQSTLPFTCATVPPQPLPEIPRPSDEVDEPTPPVGARSTVLAACRRTPSLDAALVDRGFERIVGMPDHERRPDDAARAQAILTRRWRRHRAAILDRIGRAGTMTCVTRRLERLFERRLARAWANHLSHRRLLRSGRVGAVLLDDDVTERGRSLALAARQEGLPSVVMLHGAVGHPIGALPVVADRVAVFGPHFTRWFVERGVDRERIVEVGAPRFAPAEIDRERERAALGVEGDRRLLVLALQHCNRATFFANVHWSHREWRRVVEAALAVTAERDDLHLLIKLHPSAEDGETWQRWLAEQPAQRRLSMVQSEPAAEPLLAAADALITGWSTLGLEAIVAGVPLLTVNFAGRPTPIEYARLGLAVHCNEPRQLDGAIERLLDAPPAVDPQALADVLVATGDDASRRVAELLASLAGQRRHRALDVRAPFA